MSKLIESAGSTADKKYKTLNVNFPLHKLSAYHMHLHMLGSTKATRRRALEYNDTELGYAHIVNNNLVIGGSHTISVISLDLLAVNSDIGKFSAFNGYSFPISTLEHACQNKDVLYLYEENMLISTANIEDELVKTVSLPSAVSSIGKVADVGFLAGKAVTKDVYGTTTAYRLNLRLLGYIGQVTGLSDMAIRMHGNHYILKPHIRAGDLGKLGYMKKEFRAKLRDQWDKPFDLLADNGIIAIQTVISQ